jgi:hypothetical protein
MHSVPEHAREDAKQVRMGAVRTLQTDHHHRLPLAGHVFC